MSAPAGWYPDPQDPVPDMPPQQRYWDGQSWTLHVAPIGQQTHGSYPAASTATAYATPRIPTTPDGAPLASWWHRVGATLIDDLILFVVVGVLAFPFIRDLVSAYADYFDKVMTAAQNGRQTPPTALFTEDIIGPLVAISVIGVVVNLLYTVGFLSWKQATPGKLAVGLRVRLRESPELPFVTILLRWGIQFGVPGVLGLVPFVGSLTGIFSLVNVLWPLWDDKRQAIHDKIAKTNVVRVR
jgi:uncharacterized RDD family membrane protein YckC